MRSTRCERGDALPLIANRYDITVEELADFNDWEDGAFHPIYPGDEVRIPEFAEAPEDEESPTSGPTTGSARCPRPGGGPLCPDGSERDLYEIVTGDFISRVADKNDLSIEELEAVNAENPAYQVVRPGTGPVAAMRGRGASSDALPAAVGWPTSHR